MLPRRYHDTLVAAVSHITDHRWKCLLPLHDSIHAKKGQIDRPHLTGALLLRGSHATIVQSLNVPYCGGPGSSADRHVSGYRAQISNSGDPPDSLCCWVLWTLVRSLEAGGRKRRHGPFYASTKRGGPSRGGRWSVSRDSLVLCRWQLVIWTIFWSPFSKNIEARRGLQPPSVSFL